MLWYIATREHKQFKGAEQDVLKAVPQLYLGYKQECNYHVLKWGL